MVNIMIQGVTYMKTLPLSLFGLICLAGCQQSSAPEAVQMPEIKKGILSTFSAPASDTAQTLDFTVLPEGFPVLSEIGVSALPTACALSKLNRYAPAEDGESFENRYVFTSIDGHPDGDLFYVSINGELRTVKFTHAADTDNRTVRFFKTTEGDEVEVIVSIEADGDQHKGIVGRVKAWDEGTPLMCGYNRIEVIGRCNI